MILQAASCDLPVHKTVAACFVPALRAGVESLLMTPGVAKLLMAAGAGLFLVGVLVALAGKLQLPLPGHLPGDIVIRGKGSVVYIPVMSCVLLSVILSLVRWLWEKFF